jgi:hypothetical protein
VLPALHNLLMHFLNAVTYFQQSCFHKENPISPSRQWRDHPGEPRIAVRGRRRGPVPRPAGWKTWIPAFAGMTRTDNQKLFSRTALNRANHITLT